MERKDVKIKKKKKRCKKGENLINGKREKIAYQNEMT